MVWVYMGPREVPPPFPAFEINTLPPENVAPPSIMMEESNWLQNLEGDTDSNHLDYLHSRLDAFRCACSASSRRSRRGPACST